MKEIRKLYLFTFFRSLTFFASISIAFYHENNLSYFQIMLLQSVYGILTAILEIPSGMLSDIWGRKKTLILGTVAFALAYFGGAVGTSMLPFVLMQILAAVGQSCYSGTFVALMFEDVNSDDSITQSVNVIFANMQAINIGAVLLASLSSVFIVKYSSMRITYLFTVLAYILTLILGISLCETQKEKETVKTNPFKEYGQLLKNSILYMKDYKIGLIVMDLVIFACFSNTFTYIQQPILLNAGLETSKFGYVTFIITICTVASLKTVQLIEKKIKNVNRFLCLLTMLVIVSLFSNALHVSPVWSAISFAIMTIAVRYREIFLMNALNTYISDDSRATVMSIVSAIEMIGLAVLSAVIGLVEDVSIEYAVAALCIIVVIFYLIFGFMKFVCKKKYVQKVSILK